MHGALAYGSRYIYRGKIMNIAELVSTILAGVAVLFATWRILGWTGRRTDRELEWTSSEIRKRLDSPLETHGTVLVPPDGIGAAPAQKERQARLEEAE